MHEFQLHFKNGTIRGGGTDVVGQFHFSGAYDVKTGQVLLIKQYIGKHAVRYRGEPDGEGCIQGTWEITSIAGSVSGPFQMRPRLPRAGGDEPISEVK
jgi:hypothetical protein